MEQLANRPNYSKTVPRAIAIPAGGRGFVVVGHARLEIPRRKDTRKKGKEPQIDTDETRIENKNWNFLFLSVFHPCFIRGSFLRAFARIALLRGLRRLGLRALQHVQLLEQISILGHHLRAA